LEEREAAPHHFSDAVVVAVHELHAVVTSQIHCRRPELELQDDKDGGHMLCSTAVR
jgi:hypothetical protein